MTPTPQKTRAERKPKPMAAPITEPAATAIPTPTPEIRTRLVADCAWPTDAALPEKKRAARR